jgi:hypothetical protein
MSKDCGSNASGVAAAGVDGLARVRDEGGHAGLALAGESGEEHSGLVGQGSPYDLRRGDLGGGGAFRCGKTGANEMKA